MADMFISELLVLAKDEAGSYGVDSAPAAATDAVLTKGATIRPASGQKISRDVDKSTFGNDLNDLVGKYAIMEFDVEISGSGAVDTPPGVGGLLKLAGHAETITPTTGPVEYDPISDAFPSSSLYFYWGLMLWKILGCRASVELKFDKNNYAYLHFVVWGLFDLPENATIPTPTYPASFGVPLPISKVNTPTVTLHGFAAELHGFNYNLNNTLAVVDVPNRNEVRITNRAPTAQITLAAPDLPTKDFYAIAAARTLGALQIVHGTGAGGVFTFDAGQVQIEEDGLEVVTLDDLMGLQMTLNMLPSAGDDEHKFTWS